LYARLSTLIRPCDSARGFDVQPRTLQLESQLNLLIQTQRSNGLNGYAGFAQIANNAAIAMVQIDIGQRG